MDDLKIFMGKESLLALLMTPSLIIGLVFMLAVYRIVLKLIDEFAKPYMETQKMQAQAFMRMAEQLEASRITLSALAVKLDAIEDKINGVKK